MGGEFKWRHFAGEVILLCVRWYCRYGISGSVAKIEKPQRVVLLATTRYANPVVSAVLQQCLGTQVLKAPTGGRSPTSLRY
ncbi:MAG: hypothetical protein ACXW3P_00655 [Rhodospirillales bacterium]